MLHRIFLLAHAFVFLLFDEVCNRKLYYRFLQIFLCQTPYCKHHIFLLSCKYLWHRHNTFTALCKKAASFHGGLSVINRSRCYSLDFLVVWLIQHFTCCLAPLEVVLQLFKGCANLDSAARQHQIKLGTRRQVFAEVNNLGSISKCCTGLPNCADIAICGIDKCEVSLLDVFDISLKNVVLNF